MKIKISYKAVGLDFSPHHRWEVYCPWCGITDWNMYKMQNIKMAYEYALQHWLVCPERIRYRNPAL